MNENRRSFLVRLLALVGLVSVLKTTHKCSIIEASKATARKWVKMEQWRLSRDLSHCETEQFVHIAVTHNEPRKGMQDYIKSIGVEALDWKDIRAKKTPRHSAAFKHRFPLCS